MLNHQLKFEVFETTGSISSENFQRRKLTSSFDNNIRHFVWPPTFVQAQLFVYREFFRNPHVNNFKMPSRLQQLRLLNDQKLIVCVWAFKLNFFISKYLDFVNDFWKWVAFNSNFSYKIIILHFPYDSLVHFGLDTLENAPYRFLYFLHLLFFNAIHCPKPVTRFHSQTETLN